MSERQERENAAYPVVLQRIERGVKEIKSNVIQNRIKVFTDTVLPTNETNIFEITGRTGSGKTTAAKNISSYLVSQGLTVAIYEHFHPDNYNRRGLTTQYESILSDLKFIINTGDEIKENILIIDDYPIPEMYRVQIYTELNIIAMEKNIKIILTRQEGNEIIEFKQFTGA